MLSFVSLQVPNQHPQPQTQEQEGFEFHLNEQSNFGVQWKEVVLLVVLKGPEISANLEDLTDCGVVQTDIHWGQQEPVDPLDIRDEFEQSEFSDQRLVPLELVGPDRLQETHLPGRERTLALETPKPQKVLLN